MTSEQREYRIRGREPVLQNENLIRILFDNRDPLEVPISLWVDYGLKSGLVLSAEVVATIESESTIQKWRLAALRYLSYRSRTSAEVGKYLTRKGAPAEFVDRVIVLGKNEGWLRDDVYVRQFVESRQGKASRREVAWKLSGRGVCEQDIQPILNEEWTDTDEMGAAMKVAAKYLRSHRGLEQDALCRRLWMYLQRKGFEIDAIRSVVHRAMLEMESIAHREFLDND